VQRSGISLWARAVLAVVLTLGFYALAVTGIWLLARFAVYGFTSGRINYLTILSAFFALSLAWAMVPRIARFEPGGPRLTAATQPRLFAELERIADAVGQPLPAEVYCEWDGNASVSVQGGLLGIGGRRVLTVGLPLLRVMSVAELRAVLAHEFGHFAGGDTALGPLMYRASAAMIRSVESLNSGILSWPFQLYTKLFLRVTQAISRQQEFDADALAAAVTGKEACLAGLGKLDNDVLVADIYWTDEVAHLLEEGHVPPILEGLDRFLESAWIRDRVRETVAELAKAGPSPYDSHPPTPERLRALHALPDTPPLLPPKAGDDAPALSLVDAPESLIHPILCAIGGAEAAAKLQPVTWQAVGESVWLPAQITGLMEAGPQLLAGLTPATLELTPERLEALGKRLAKEAEVETEDPDELRGAAGWFLGTSILLALLDAGHPLHYVIGAPPGILVDGELLAPTYQLREMLDAKRTGQSITTALAGTRAANLDLQAVVERAATARGSRA
jgi:Zn-dependent protease with chaperone function